LGVVIVYLLKRETKILKMENKRSSKMEGMY